LIPIQVLGTNKLCESENFPSLILEKGFDDRINLFNNSHNLIIDKEQFSFILAIIIGLVPQAIAFATKSTRVRSYPVGNRPENPNRQTTSNLL
jgi:hypothetical protein